jgi:hypothetical protein
MELVLPERAAGYELKSPNVQFHHRMNFPCGVAEDLIGAKTSMSERIDSCQ